MNDGPSHAIFVDMSEKQKIGADTFASNPGNRGKGRPKGAPNKTTALLKDAILQAATEAGGPEGLVGYLKFVAADSPAAFTSLLGKVLPMQVAHEGEVGVRLVIRNMLKDD